MNSLVVSHVKPQRGFTLVELLLVASLIVIVSAFMFPLGVTFYQAQVLNETSEGIVSTLRRAHAFALSGKNNSSHGIRFLPDSYVLFEGHSYSGRNVSEDEVYPLSSRIVLDGPEEINFELFVGTPSATGTISVTAGEKTVSVEVLESGVIYH